MSIECRFLAVSDIPQIDAVVRSRATYLAGSTADHDRLVTQFADRLKGGSLIMGLFEDYDLDALFEWKPIGLAPRADDARRYDEGALVISQWSRAKAGGRAKLDSGHDINAGHLLNAAIGAMDARGLFTYWYLTPAAWVRTPQRDNPLHAEMASKRIARVAGTLQAGQAPEGQYAGFIRRRIAQINGTAEPMAAHVSTLKDEYRHAG